MKRARSKLGKKKGLSPIFAKIRNWGTGDTYYCGRTSSEKGPSHEGQSQNVDDIATKPMTCEIIETAHDPPSNTNAPSFQFSVKSEEGLNLMVDLNFSPSAWAKSISDVHIDENLCLTPAMGQEIVEIPTEEHLPLESDTYKETLMGDKLMKEISTEDLNSDDKLPNSYQLVVFGAKSSDDDDFAKYHVDGNLDHISSPPSSSSSIHTAAILYNYYHRKMSPQLAFADANRFFTCAALSAGEDLLAYLTTVHKRGNTPGEDVRLSVTDRAAMDACEIAEALDADSESPDVSLWPISKVAVILFNQTSKKCLVEYGPDTKGVWSFIEKEIDAEADNSHDRSQPTGQESTNKASSAKKASSGTSDAPYMLQQLAYSEMERRTGIKRSNVRVVDEDMAYSLSKKWTTTKVFIIAYEEIMKTNLVEIPLEELIRSMTGPLFTSDPFLTTSTVVDYYHILPYQDILFELLHRKWPSDSRVNDQLRPHGKCSLHSVIDENLKDQEANSKSKMQKRNLKVSTPKPNKQVIKPTGTNSNHNDGIGKYKKNNKRKSEASRPTASAYAEGQDGAIPREGNHSPVLVDVETSKPVIKPVNVKATAAEKSSLQMDKNKTKKQSTCGNIPQDDVPTEAPFVDPVIKNGGLEGQTVEVPEKSVGHNLIEVPEKSVGHNLIEVSEKSVGHNLIEVLEKSVRHNLIEVPEKSVQHNLIEVSEKSGGITENKNGQIYDSLQSIWKRQDDVIDKQCMLEERNAQYDMDIQTILSEGEMTPKVMSIIDKYKDTSSNMIKVVNSYCSGEGGHAPSTKRRKLKEATLLQNPCQELDKICRGNNWILPRYTILPSVAAGMFHARVRLTGVDFDMSVDGDHHMTPREARSSAAANMIFELHKKAREEITRPEQPERRIPS